ncbi:hypothetical protein GPL21_39165 [Bradyrhizobium pachyrhizi]|uniref:Uncharacterized protein n=1 Tax=Bradyrhizobium pachyrhizi TaxID=280333 RepID=A0A844T0C9_9BRAD|nr:hypothetical protein [Bradyrhizobium pachyrhizi]MVT71065.1 hypothetical protein [Bradyrhizobium pachyrhizi]
MDDLKDIRTNLAALLERVDRALGAAASPESDGPFAGDDDLISTAAAAQRANRDQETIRRWCAVHGIGVKVAGRWEVSARQLHAFQLRSKKTV